MWGRDIDVLGILVVLEVLEVLEGLGSNEGLGRNEGLGCIESGKSGVLEVFLQFFCKIFGQFKILLYFRVLNCVQTKEATTTAAWKCRIIAELMVIAAWKC